jgi:AcrR family transcriptional regulator
MLAMPAAGSLRVRKKQRTASAIAEATVALVGARGFDVVRIDDICAVAEVGRSTFFRYFDSKEASFVAGVHQGRLDAVLEALDRRPPDEDALRAVRGAFLDVIDGWREQREALVLDAHIRSSSDAVRAWGSAQHVVWQQAIALAVEPRLPRGPNRSLQAQVLVAGALTAVRIATDRWIETGARRSPAKLFTAAFDAVAEMMGETT